MDKYDAHWAKFSKRCVASCGLFSILLGAFVVTCWHMGWIDLVRLSKSNVPVHYYSGVLFILSGLSLILTCLKKIRYAGIFVAICGVAYAAMTGSQYVLYNETAIDGAFDAFMPDGVSQQNNAAPNTLLCFFIGNISILFWWISKNDDFRRGVVVLPSVVIATISSIAFLGYLTDISQAYSWWSYSPMAFHTTYGLCVLSFGLLMLSGNDGYKIQLLWSRKSILAGAVGVAITLLITQILIHFEKENEKHWLDHGFEIAQTLENLILMGFATGIGLSVLIAYLLQQNEKIKQILVTLRQSEESHALATAAANIGLWDWDIKNENVKWTGNAWKLLGGRSNSELPDTNTTIRARMPDEDRLSIDENIIKSMRKNDMFSVEFRFRRLDNNKEVWLLSSGRRVHNGLGEPIRSSGIIMDVTERKEAERYLLRSNQELEQFAYVASHDLKAPLRSIDNLAKWVVEDYADMMPEDAKEKLILLRGRVARLEALLSDILSYSRAGRITEPATRIDIQTMFRSLREIYIPDNFSLRTSSELQIIHSPKTALEQVLANLLSNAVKHHDKKQGEIELTLEDEAAYYKFTVSDDGPGIPEEFHERVFQMFQTLQSRDKIDGSGLGMSIIKKLVEWQGGKVWIKVKEGRGTSICVLWPKTSVSQHAVDVIN